MFKIIVAGGRNFHDFSVVVTYLDRLLRKRLQEGEELIIVSGAAPGVDKLGADWAHLNKIDVKEFPAPWDDIEGKPASQIGVTISGKKYWKRAGHVRNKQMAEYADGLIAFWDGQSRGTSDMISQAKKHKLKVKVVKI